MNQQEQLDTLNDIRNIMNRSSKFISLSGLSGVFAGATALVGAYVAHKTIQAYLNGDYGYGIDADSNLEIALLKIAFLVLVIAVTGAAFFTYRQSKKRKLPIWDSTTKNLLINLFIPLATGGFFIIALLLNHISSLALVAPSTLIFYGLALINASKYTYSDIRFLGICEIILGIIAIFNVGYGLYFWAAGFGVLHILYGGIMYFKYEKN
jgi:predicted lysophospholipase L1 biosynthesis ABC-type transport system permease subunit